MKSPNNKEMVTFPRIFMGVSLSNLTFSREFTKRFAEWIREQRIQHALVVIFDTCEVVNIKVFQGLPQGEAQQRSVLRTQEMKKMFQKAVLSETVQVTTQSEYGEQLSQLPRLLDFLRRGYHLKQSFYQDVREQVWINLSIKAKRIGKEIIEKNIDALSEYILLELAWLYAFFDQDAEKTVEAYPGPELFTKRKLIRGEYQSEIGIQALNTEPKFLDIRSLLKK